MSENYELFDDFLDGILIIRDGSVQYLNGTAVTILQLKSARELLNKQLASEFPEFEPLNTSRNPTALVFREVTIDGRLTKSKVTLLIGSKNLKSSADRLVYCKDITIEVSLQTKFVREKMERQRALAAAEIDTLTGCYNKAGLISRLKTKFTKSAQDGGVFTLVVLDLDGFKAVNDRFGHQNGDWFLAKISEVIRACLRDRDLVGRFGGDEFVIILTDCGRQDAITVIGRLRDAIARFKLAIDQDKASVTASIGACSYSRLIGSADEMFQFADSSSYVSKRAGKNAFCIYPDAEPYKVQS